MKIEQSKEQEIAYNRFIKARNKVGIPKRTAKWIPQSDVLACVDVTGLNHPMYVQNDDWIEYKEAFLNWLKVEPRFREYERMRSTRGDYGTQDSWEEKASRVKEL